jgi:mannose-6-phosphate isomerase-like protein (cupin superfamily)
MTEGGGAVARGDGAAERGDGIMVRTVLDTGAAGHDGLIRRLVEVPPGSRFEATAGAGGELWYVLGGQGMLTSGAEPATALGPDTGLWLPPGARYRLSADPAARLRLDNVSLPAATPVPEDAGAEAAGVPGDAAAPRVSVLADCAVEVTGDRRFRVLFGPGRGCDAATQFVGEIPPGRAPLHRHTYDEVVLVLEGEGVLHAGPGGHPLAPGSCIHLPPGQEHCLENTGQDTLRVLGVFHPGGSPAAKTAAS